MSVSKAAWVSPAFFLQLQREIASIACFPISIEDERERRLRLWPDGGGFSPCELVVLAERAWIAEEPPPGGHGPLSRRLDHWKAEALKKWSLEEGLAVMGLGALTITVDFDGSFEPFTLRLPDEERRRNPSIKVLGGP